MEAKIVMTEILFDIIDLINKNAKAMTQTPPRIIINP